MGSVYVDCPVKPCYLCKRPGHTTASCPFRLAPDAGGAAAAGGASSSSSGHNNVLHRMLRREVTERLCHSSAVSQERYDYPKRWRVTAAVLKLHSRRVTCLDFCPAKPSLLVSGDKRGQVAFWDHVQVFDKTVLEHGAAHMWLVTAFKFLPPSMDADHVYSASVDGTVCRINIETQQVAQVGNLNPGATWTDDMEDGTWRSAYAMDALPSRQAMLCGDDIGQVHLLDVRSPGVQAIWLAGKAKNKLVSVAVNPADDNLVCCAGNDHFARLWDVRVMTSGSSGGHSGGGNKALSAALATLPHPRVVSHAAFSPITGRTLVTTCTDNRLRVWDRVGVAGRVDGPPSREIVHSHDFSRYLTSFKGVFDPKDPTERTLLIGRYISEDYDGLALHPIDVFDTATGRQQAELIDSNVATICPIAVPHPTEHIVAAGSSRNIFVWEPVPADELEDEEGDATRHDGAQGGGSGGAAAGKLTTTTWQPRMLDLDDKKKGGASKGKGKAKGDDEDDDGDGGPFKKKQKKDTH